MPDTPENAPLKPLANVITLGVRDLDRQRGFYRDLGWPQVVDDDDFAAFELRGSVLALFPVEKLAADGRATPEVGTGGIRFTIGIVVDSPEEVDRVADRFRTAGGGVTKEPVDAEFFDGRSAYVSDPEANFFEIVWAGPGNAILAAARRAAGLTPAEEPRSR
jgi:catechol 2,3-dioxygenase-like lactoylglutathione lyase family enzyme